MKTEGGSGFNPEKFRKLVGMFDSPYSEEAVAAFRRALAELKKNQLKFIDQFGNNEETDRLRRECESIRAELKEAFGRCAKREAQAEELQGIIDRLHERIAAMEGEANATGEFGDGRDQDTEPFSPPYWEPTPSPVDPGTWDEDQNTGQVPSMTRPKVAFWIGLPLVIVLYALISWNRGRLLTDEDWLIVLGYWWVWLPLLVGTGAAIYRYGVKKGFAESQTGRICNEKLSSSKVMLKALRGVSFAWWFAYVIQLGIDKSYPPGNVFVVVVLLVPTVVVGTLIRNELADVGWEGLIVKFALMVEGAFACATALFERNIWAINSYPAFHIVHPPTLFFIVYAVSWVLVCSTRVTLWVLDEEVRKNWVIVPAILLIAISVIVVADHKSSVTPVHGAVQSPPVTKQPKPLPHRRKSTASPGAFVGREYELHTVSLGADEFAPKEVQTSFMATSATPVDAAPPNPPSPMTNAGVLLFLGIVALWVLKSIGAAKERKRLEKARKDAFSFSAPNVHGSAGAASKKVAKKRGWV